jgi:hypothetical protein
MAPAPASLPARIVSAGGISTVAPGGPGRPLVKTARLPDSAPVELVDELREGGWHVEWMGSPRGWKTVAPGEGEAWEGKL